MSALAAQLTARRWGLLLLVVVVAAAALGRLFTGRMPLEDGSVVLDFSLPEASVAGIRLTAILAALVVGGSLGLSGLAFQVLLRNPLASPFVLGVSSGAGFGIMLGQWLASMGGVAGMVGLGLLSGEGAVGAGLGAIVALVLVQWVGRMLGGFDPVSLVLAGIILSATFAAAIMLLQHLVPHGLRDDLVSWMMGRIPWSISGGIMLLAGLLMVGCAVLGMVMATALDASCLGEDEARSVGVPIEGMRVGLLVCGGALAAMAVVIAGPIAFVGLVAPHAARALVGSRNRWLVPGSLLAGMAILLMAESVRQLIDLGAGRLPIGVLTALMGGPAFLFLLLRRGASR